jgi:NAD(P)H-dependent FMN reductase
MLRLAVILGSVRQGRRGAAVADWVLARAAAREDVDVTLLDLADFPLPLFAEARPPMARVVADCAGEWAQAIARADAFVFVTPEYNRSFPGALKNAIDFLYYEWNDKAAGFVSYGAEAGGARAVEHLRTVMGELRVADVRSQVAITVGDDFDDHAAKADAMLDEVIAWGTALRA